VATGTSFPASPSAGELFYRTDLTLLHVYDGSSWTEVGAGSGGGSAGDAYFNQTSLLLNFAGTNATQRTYDASVRLNTLTFGSGNSTISSTQSKFGGTSLFLNNASGSSPGYVSTTANTVASSGLDLSTQAPDWTVEAWAYPTALPSLSNELSGTVIGWGGGFGAGWASVSILIKPSGVWQGQWNNANSAGGDVSINGSAVTLNSWVHLAVSKSDGTIRFFINGTLQGSSTTNTNNYFSSSPWRVGAGVNDTYRFIGYVDDVRVTKGVARYTATFTAPTEANPTFQSNS
jgi:hypothetical protein